MMFQSSRACPLLLFLLLGAVLACDGAAESSELASEEASSLARIRVRTALVRSAHLDHAERVVGVVRAFRKATVTAETAGRVLARPVERGQRVDTGHVLLEIDASRLELALRKAEATLRAKQTNLAHATREQARGERLALQSAISEQQRDDLQHALDRASDEHALARVERDTARRNLADARISAPFPGRVDDLRVDVGDYVSPGTPVATLVELSKARIFGGVTAIEAARLEAGSEARVTFADLGGETFVGELRSIGQVASEGDGTYPLEIWVEDAGGRLRDGLVAEIELPANPEAPSLLAHRAALLRRNGRPEAFVVEREGDTSIARLRSVRTGRSAGEWIEILDGLRAGDELVIDGQFALRPGAPVTVDGTPTPPVGAGETQ
jgi:membrane fusion protein (multidrug efflux system)